VRLKFRVLEKIDEMTVEQCEKEKGKALESSNYNYERRGCFGTLRL
jgi:hypothetical protein